VTHTADNDALWALADDLEAMAQRQSKAHNVDTAVRHPVRDGPPGRTPATPRHSARSDRAVTSDDRVRRVSVALLGLILGVVGSVCIVGLPMTVA
jgi:hypothetical protein